MIKGTHPRCHTTLWPRSHVGHESLISQSLLQPNLTRQWLIISRAHPWCHMTLWPRDQARSCGKLKTLYLLFQNVYDLETLLSSHLRRFKITYNVLWQSGDHVTNSKCNISSLTRPMDTKFSELMTYDEVNAPTKSHVLLTISLHKVTWQTKNDIFLTPEDLWPPNLAGCWHMGSHSPWWSCTNLITWSQEVTCQIENLISPLLQGLYHHT